MRGIERRVRRLESRRAFTLPKMVLWVSNQPKPAEWDATPEDQRIKVVFIRAVNGKPAIAPSDHQSGIHEA